jgi:hypothetical protein
LSAHELAGGDGGQFEDGTANPFDEGELQMSDLKRFWDAVTQMREAQKLEWAALPGNYRLWKRARQQQAVSQLEQRVDALAEELLHTYCWTDEDEEDDAPADVGQAGDESADLKKVQR